MFTLIAFLVPVLFVAAMGYQVVQRGRQLRDLAERGVQTNGAIVARKNKSRRAGISYSLTYRYIDSFGIEHQRSIVASLSEYRTLQPGDAVIVVYLPDQPDVSALEKLAGVARQAIQK